MIKQFFIQLLFFCMILYAVQSIPIGGILEQDPIGGKDLFDKDSLDGGTFERVSYQVRDIKAKSLVKNSTNYEELTSKLKEMGYSSPVVQVPRPAQEQKGDAYFNPFEGSHVKNSCQQLSIESVCTNSPNCGWCISPTQRCVLKSSNHFSDHCDEFK